MAVAVVALTVLVVLPLMSLLLCERHRGGATDARPLPRGAVPAALRPGPQELADPGGLDGAPERRHRAADGLGGEPDRRAGEGVHPRHGDGRVPHAALSHRDRLREPLQPERGARQPVDPQTCWACPSSRSTSTRWPAWSSSPSCTRSRSSTCWRRARSSPSTRRWRSRPGSWARAGGGRRAPSPCRWWRPAILAGALVAFVNAIALFGSQAIIGLPGPHLHAADADLRALRPPAALRTGVGALARLRRDHGGRARASAPLPGPALVRHPRRQGQPTAGRPAGRGPLGGARVLHRGLRGGRARAVRHAAGRLGEPVVGARLLAEPDAAALPVHPLRVRRHAAGDREQSRAGRRRRRH